MTHEAYVGVTLGSSPYDLWVQEMVQYLKEGDLARAELPGMAGRCRRRSFFLAATAALRSRRVWDSSIWCAMRRARCHSVAAT